MVSFYPGVMTVYEKYHFKGNRFSIVTPLTFKVAIMIENRTLVRTNQSNVIFETYLKQTETQIVFDSV